MSISEELKYVIEESKKERSKEASSNTEESFNNSLDSDNIDNVGSMLKKASVKLKNNKSTGVSSETVLDFIRGLT